MGPLGLSLSALAALHIGDLFEAPMLFLDFPACLRKREPSQFVHFGIVGCPVFRCPVPGNDSKQFHHTVLLEMGSWTGMSNSPIRENSKLDLLFNRRRAIGSLLSAASTNGRWWKLFVEVLYGGRLGVTTTANRT